jgi:signal peptidase I
MTDRSTSPPPPPPRQPRPQQSSATNVKETIESILIAFILAFIFRAFVVEAFIIPTGSMAPTLLGAHMRFRCPDCGYRFTVNYSSADESSIPSAAGPIAPRDRDGRVTMVDRVYSIHCPNCGYKLPRTDLDDQPNDATNPGVYYGDRILVLKSEYLLHAPQRGDVVVFKSPYAPKQFGYTQNYIKRLVGKPLESVMILDGDIYVRAPGQEQFQVQTKPFAAQEAVWRIVYDNDFYPRGQPRDLEEPWQQPWQLVDGKGWDLGSSPTKGRTFRFRDAAARGSLRFNPDVDIAKHSFTDWLAYDVTGYTQQPNVADTYDARDVGDEHTVSDLKLAMTYHRLAGQGPLELRLSKLDHTFIARIEPQQVQLLHQRGTGAPVPVGQPVKLSDGSRGAGGDPLRIEFMNVDYRVTLRIDGRDVIQTTPAQYAPDIDALLDAYKMRRQLPPPEVQIVADRQVCDVSHVSLWRDIYYINRALPGQDRIAWGTPEHPMELGPDEYFVLGDNSAISLDARCWTDPIRLRATEDLDVEGGRVPGRFLLGKAFFVYWPAGYRPLSDNSPGIIPNVGDMRFIH